MTFVRGGTDASALRVKTGQPPTDTQAPRSGYRFVPDAMISAHRTVRQLLVPDDVYELGLNDLVTSNLFRRGHRVRVQISSTFFPNFSRNLHTGDLETVSARMQRATIRVYHDREHPSHISLPVAAR